MIGDVPNSQPMSHKQSKAKRQRSAQIDKEICLLDQLIEQKELIDALAAELEDWVSQHGTWHGDICTCWQCRATQSAKNMIAKAKGEE